jgi:hypothetical protein
MLVFNQKFYDFSGTEIFITSTDNLFFIFSNGEKWLKFEIELHLKNERASKAVSISNRIELERRQNKFLLCCL